MSADGSFIAGNESAPYDARFVWTVENGIQNLDTLLTQNGISIPSLLASVVVRGVSADGTSILCQSVNTAYYANTGQPFIISGFPARGPYEFVSPTLHIRGPRQIIVHHATVRIRGTATDANLVGGAYRIGDGAWVTFSHRPVWNVKIRGLRPGANLVTFRATDATGNSATQSITVIKK